MTNIIIETERLDNSTSLGTRMDSVENKDQRPVNDRLVETDKEDVQNYAEMIQTVIIKVIICFSFSFIF